MNVWDKLLVLWRYAQMRRKRRWRSREAFDRWREARVVRQLGIVRRRSSFYRSLWGTLPNRRWREFPAIDKQRMMAHFDTLNTVGVRKADAFALALEAERTRDFTPMLGGVTVGLSSGTSGNRGLFLVSRAERLAWTGAVLARVLPRSLVRRQRIAFFLRANSNLYDSVGGSRLEFCFYDLLDPLEAHVQRLKLQQPTLLVAPPSMLRVLADERLAGRLPLRPERLVSVAETLDPLDRRAIEAAFGQLVHQVYQCTEGFLAHTCKFGTLHLNEDIVYIEKEYVDREQGKFVPIITDFSRLAQPVVRYRLNDLLVERQTPCPCGSLFTAIERIEGRCDDIYYLRAVRGEGLVRVFPDFITRAVIGASERIASYRTVLHSPDFLEVTLELDNGCGWKQEQEQERLAVEAAVRAALQALCERLQCRLPQLQFTPYDFTPGERKLRRVERRFTIEFSEAGLIR